MQLTPLHFHMTVFTLSLILPAQLCQIYQRTNSTWLFLSLLIFKDSKQNDCRGVAAAQTWQNAAETQLFITTQIKN